MEVDIAIIGGGPAGYTAAERAAENGLKTILFEKNTIGGVCLNVGCIPTKTLLYSAKILDYIRHADAYGIQPGAEPAFDLAKMIARKNKTVRKLTAGVKMRLTAGGVTIRQEEAVLASEKDNKLIVRAAGEEITASYVLLCTGSEAIIPPIPGLDKVAYWTSTEALDITQLPASLAIIGGGVIGMEFASFFNSMGVQVKVIEMLPEILGVMDKETAALLRKEYTKRGIDFILNAKVTEVKPDAIVVEKEGSSNSIPAKKILLSVGRRPNVADIGLDTLTIHATKKGVEVNDYMQTSHPKVYACGDINGKSMFAHTAYHEAEIAIRHILGEEEAMEYRAIPAVVYTNPELASCGYTEEELQQEGKPYHLVKIPMTYSGRFVAENEGFNGLCKLLTNPAGEIIGCQLLGNPASEIIVTAGIAITNRYTVEEFRKNIFPHPTVGEVIHESLYI